MICVALPESSARKLGLPLMNPGVEKSPLVFTVSVEARAGVTTGISAADRARTIKVLATTESPRLDLVMPGHVFPIQVKDGGVLVKNAAPEAAVDLLKMADQPPFATISHILNSQGEFISEDNAQSLSSKLKLPIVNVSEVLEKRLSAEVVVDLVSRSTLPLKGCLLYTSPSPRDATLSRMPSSA